jgi:preprotein translocase subunit SecE
MARKPGSTPQAMRTRAAKTAAVMTSGGSVAQAAAPKKRTSVAQFAKEVRVEARKITWTSGRETWITSVMVGIMVVLAAGFFFFVDLFIGSGMRWILQLTSAG